MITAVLINYKRPKELAQIVEHLKTIPQINEILVRDNSVTNLYDFGRYVEAKKAKNDTLYFQDDDCIVNNILHLISLYDGTRLVCGMKPEHRKLYKGKEQLLGWGSLLDKSWFKYLKAYTDVHPKDELFYYQADRVLTGLLPSDPLVVDADITEFPSAYHSMAMYRRDDFYTKKQVIQDRVSKLCLV